MAAVLRPWLVLGLMLAAANATRSLQAQTPEPTIAGRVTFVRTMQSEVLDHTTIKVTLKALDAPERPSVTTAINTDGTFALTATAPGSYVLSAILPPAFDRWWLQSATVDTRDLLDTRIEVTPDLHLAGVLLTFIDRRPELTGKVQAQDGAVVTSAPVVVFPVDEKLREAPRRVVWMKSDTTGHYAFRDLPPGEYWIAVLSQFDPHDLADSLFFDMIGAIAMKTTVGELERKTLDLTAK